MGEPLGIWSIFVVAAFIVIGGIILVRFWHRLTR